MLKIGEIILVVVCSCVIITNCMPADSANETPTKIDLSFDASANFNPTNHLLESKADYIGENFGAAGAVGQIATIFNGPPTKIEHAVDEHESIFSKKDSFYTGLHEHLANLFQYKPIVDTIKEEDKYGNDGEKFSGIGKFVVGTAEGVANFLNKAVEVPYQAFRAIIQTTNEKLNHLGGKIVGLEK